MPISHVCYTGNVFVLKENEKIVDFQQFIVLFPLLHNEQLQTIGTVKRRPCAHE